ncbi:hypothetical protein MPTK1_1g26980 [Marchantia polymorpha subsp. ruderalis]|uniref:Uncharacterized protein n=2 Tax=Marchantia polymorpha TaxID=3197 RepID=A0AAF6AUQ2_MARPO|nr:hypothetical protein MARPO_0002s0180 [Marchantia polymorpha]BBN00173.1 hypothetical protein Mp_1g26980 [Marchantia polymorpha subsp. ruderalis]|eukprot:PTQ49711.1 hypothetical protein MARPO_0002s0180 [Marchantia polymorpha]
MGKTFSVSSVVAQKPGRLHHKTWSQGWAHVKPCRMSSIVALQTISYATDLHSINHSTTVVVTSFSSSC